ncbi:MAG TPA: hypothetical protein VGU74_17380 [Gemmatimonadales bacterium]|nr:hypothetical protein [Gemmatimonadales bacterium]
MRDRTALLIALAGSLSCGGPLPTNGDSTGSPAAIAQVRLYDASRGTELTVHTGLPDDESILIEARLYAADGHRLTDIVGGVGMDLEFNPTSLATSVPVPGRPLQQLVSSTSPVGTSGTQTVVLRFPASLNSRSFGPFHVEVESGTPTNAEMRLFDAFNAELTQHVPLVQGDTTRIEVRLYDSTGARRTNIPGGVDISFRFDPESLAVALPIPRLPFWKAVTPTSALGTEGSLFVSVLFLADSTTKTYGPIQVLVH